MRCCSKSGLSSLKDCTTYVCRDVVGECVLSRLVGIVVCVITKHDHLVDVRAFGVRQNNCCLT
jgi:hypothetical protein